VKRLLQCRLVERRAELAEGALAYVLEHGLIGLSLRPLAAALDTSDRMVIYHFGSKEGLITEIVALASQRVAGSLQAVDPATLAIQNAGDLVRYAWQALTGPDATSAMRVYLEMCVLSVRDPSHWSAAQQQIRDPWLAMLRQALIELETPEGRASVFADLILDTLDGLLLDRLIGTAPARSDAAAAAFADLLE
jgi:AcrR family transcriptional regulator